MPNFVSLDVTKYSSLKGFLNFKLLLNLYYSKLLLFLYSCTISHALVSRFSWYLAWIFLKYLSNVWTNLKLQQKFPLCNIKNWRKIKILWKNRPIHSYLSSHQFMIFFSIVDLYNNDGCSSQETAIFSFWSDHDGRNRDDEEEVLFTCLYFKET